MRGFLLALILAVSGTTAAAEPVIGPFGLGMTFEEARAAAPRAAWEEVQSKFTQKIVALSAKKAVTLAGKPFDVTLKPGYYGAYEIKLSRVREGGGARACGRDAIDAVADLERRFGRFIASGDYPGAADWSLGLPGSMFLQLGASPASVLKAGQESQVDQYQAVLMPAWAGWFAVRPPQGGDALTVKVGSSLWPAPDGPMSCTTGVIFSYRPPRPDFETIDFAALKPLSTPTTSAKHRSLEGVPPLPPEGVALVLDCEVSRVSGRPEHCAAPAALDPLLAAAAIYRVKDFSFEKDPLDPDSDVPLKIQLPIRLDPADRRPTTPPADVQPVAMTAVAWINFKDLSRFYPERAQRLEISGVVQAVCQIQDDHSVICGEPHVISSMPSAFDGVGSSLEKFLRAAPALKDGSPSAGRWVQVSVNFRI